MIITKTPFRISFFGGGTDYPVWYKKYGGAVLSTTINKYCYISTRYLPPFFEYKYRIRYTVREETKSLAQIKHPSVKACLKFLNIKHGIEMVHTSDIPARSGIGSSSSFTVGFLNSLYPLIHKMPSKKQLALDAINVEQNIIKEYVGSQDQVAAAYGGFNQIIFNPNGELHVKPITIGEKKLKFLQKHLMLFFTGLSRNASDIAKEQIGLTPSKKKELTNMMQIVSYAIDILNGPAKNFYEFGNLLNKAWQIKKNLTNLISNSKIDAIYETGLKAGAIGGKLLGAGGGGFMLFFAKPKHHAKIKEKLKKFLYVPFEFESQGSQIILYTPQDFF